MVGKSKEFDRDAWQTGWRLWLATLTAVGALFALVWPRLTRWWRKPKAFGQMKVLVTELSDAFDPNKMD